MSSYIKGIYLLLLLFLPAFGACSKYPANTYEEFCYSTSRACLTGKVLVRMITTRGIITLELDGDVSPITATNFLDLVQRGIYENTVFHRVIRTPSPFLVQGGDPTSKDPLTPKINYGNGNFIDSNSGEARFIPLEIKLKTKEQPIYNKLITNPTSLSDLELTHERGSIAMARSQKLGSGSAQFYIALKPLPELDGRYSVFGRIVDGLDVLDRIRQGDTVEKMYLLAR